MNHPSVRFDTLNISRATAPTSSSVVAAIRAGQRLEHGSAANGVEIPKLVSHVRHAVLVEHQLGL